MPMHRTVLRFRRKKSRKIIYATKLLDISFYTQMVRLINIRATYKSKTIWTIFLHCFSTDLGFR